MRKRYLYLALFGIPGFILSGIIALLVCGLAIGVLWLLVFGDGPWPVDIEQILPFLFALVFLPMWLALMVAGFFAGKYLERDPEVNKKHILVAIGATLLPVLWILCQQSLGGL